MKLRNVRRFGAGDDGRGYKIPVADFQHQTTSQPGVFRPAHQRHSNDGVFHAGAQDTRNGNGEHHTGEGNHHIGYAHDDGIHPAAKVACKHAKDTAQRKNDGDHREGCRETGAGTVDHPGKHIPPQLVRTADMLCTGGLQGILQHRVRGTDAAGNHRGKNSAQNNEKGEKRKQAERFILFDRKCRNPPGDTLPAS